jgi:hypothetical protein
MDGVRDLSGGCRAAADRKDRGEACGSERFRGPPAVGCA